MDQTDSRLGHRPILFLPKSGPSERSSTNCMSHVAPTSVSDGHTMTGARYSTLQGDICATFVDEHTGPFQSYTAPNLCADHYLPYNVDTHLATGRAAPVPLSSLETQLIPDDPFQFFSPSGVSCSVPSYQGTIQNPFAGPQQNWTQPFVQSGETFPMGDAYEPYGSSIYTSTNMELPSTSAQVWANSLGIWDNPPTISETSSFPAQGTSHGSSHQLGEINLTEGFFDFSASRFHEYRQSFPLENVEPNLNSVGAPLENPRADNFNNDFSMLLDSSTTAKRLDPDLAAVLLGIPEDPRIATENKELPFSYKIGSGQITENDSTGVTQSPNTLQSSDSASSPTLTKISSHRSSVTVPLEQLTSSSSYPSENRQLQLESDEETEVPMEISKEADFGVLQQRLRTVLPLLPPPADFSHTHIVVSAPEVHSSKAVEKYLREAAEAKKKGENKLADSLPSLTNLAPTEQSVNQKRGRSPEEDPIDISDHETCKALQDTGTETEADTLALTIQPPFSRKKRGKLGMQQRVSTATIRKLGACLRCGIFKEKCSDRIPCERCVVVAQNSKSTFSIPCWRSKLGDIELFRRRTQHGLFVYTYTKQTDSLHTRSVRIFEPEKLKPSSRQQLPFPCQQELLIESLRPLRYVDSHLLLPRDENGRLLQYACTIEQLEKGHVITTFLDRQMKLVLNTLGTSHQFVRLTLDIAERYSQSPNRKMLRNSLRIFTARFLRRKFWVSTPDETSYDVAWMDVPWRAMPTLPPKTPAEAETLNEILKDYLHGLEKRVIRGFRAKVYARNREDWFELFLVTFIFQVVLSEKLEMSFYSNVKGVKSALEMPWSTFGGLRSYSSQAIAVHFRAIKGSFPFRMPSKDRAAFAKLGDLENSYLNKCPKVLKDSMLKKDDLGSRRSSSSGHGGTPGSWWQWAIETVLESDTPD